jgi:hypothetical protein
MKKRWSASDFEALHLIFFCIFDCIPGSAGFAIINSDYPGRSIHHPLVADLKASAAIAFANIAYKVCSVEYVLITLLPVRGPAVLKALVRNGGNEVEIRIVLPKLKNNLTSPNVHTTSHACYKGYEPIIYRLEDRRLQVSFYFSLRPSQFLWAMPSKATTM